MSALAKPRIKVCGLTREEDARLALELGAWALGFIFYAKSPRAVTLESAAPILRGLLGHKTVGVFVNESLDGIARAIGETGLSTVQLHGDEAPSFCRELKERLPGVGVIKALQPRSPDDLAVLSRYAPHCEAILLDAYAPGQRGGTGTTGDWALARLAAPDAKVILAGGLNPSNIADAMRVPGIFAVDASSGLEESPGVKSSAKLKEFFIQADQFLEKRS